MPKLHWIKFHPYDWMNDTRELSAEAKGCLIDILCLMWNAQERGRWVGDYNQFARVTGIPWESAPRIIAELSAKVLRVTDRNNLVTLENRRMLREDSHYKNAANRQKRFRSNAISNASVTDKTLKTLKKLDVQDVRRRQLQHQDIALPREPIQPVELREYRIPEPKEDPTAALVMYYKAVKKTIPFDDRSWDKTHWPRSAKAASAVLKVCGSYESARACIDEVSESMGEKSWTLETIVRWAHEWKAKQGGKDYGATNSTRFYDAVAKQRTNSKFAGLRANATAGQILDSVRDMQRLQLEAEGTDIGASRDADENVVAGIREDAVEAEAD